MIHAHLKPHEDRRPALEPMLPLINVVFLLLMFFMIAGQLAPGYDVQAPESEAARDEEQRELPTLVIRKDGELSLNDQVVDPTSLAELLEAHAEQPIRLVSDADIALDKLRQLLSQLRELGIHEVRLVTRGTP